jgi:DNA-binding MarR family transcriptional regulator
MPMTTIREELKQKKPFGRKSEEALVSLLRTAELVRRLIDGTIEETAGITGQQYNVLRILRGAGERGLPTLDIVDRLVEETPGITRLIDRLEAKGLVVRERCKTDRRQVFCQITRNGLALLDKLDEPLAAALDAAVSSLKKKDLSQLIELLDKTRDGVHKTKEKQS